MIVKCMGKVEVDGRCSCCNCKPVYEWLCPECKEEGNYSDIRKPLDLGVDSCPGCGTEVKEI